MDERGSFDPTSWQIRDWKRIAWDLVREDRLVCPSSAFVFLMSIHSDGGGEADGRVYDGTSAISTGKYFQLYCADERFRAQLFTPPLYFAKGIYVDEGTNVDCIVIQYLPWHS
jgi:hypothetical protein